MHLTGAEMTASALVHLFLALILNTEGTNCDLNNFFRFENFGGASQGILGNHASFLLDPSDINSTHHIWELDPDLKKCETFTETGDLPAQCVPCLILHEICFIISFFFSIFVHWGALPFNAGRGSLWVPEECTHRPDRWTSICTLYMKYNKIYKEQEEPSHWTQANTRFELRIYEMNTRKIHAVLLSLILVSVFCLVFL